MYRSNSDDVMRAVHIDSLKQAFATVETVSESDGTTTLRVDQAMPKGQIVSILVTLTAEFPRSAPLIRTLGGRDISIADRQATATTSSSALGASVGPTTVWDAATSLLGIAVGNAMTNLIELLGDLAPPTVESILPSLSSLSDDVLSDLVSNSLCMECYAYQLPYAKRAREESKAVASLLEKTATDNLKSRALVEQMAADVQALQQRCTEYLKMIQEVRERPSFVDMCTVAGVTRVVDGFIKQTAAEANRDAERVLSCQLPAERDQFESSLSAYVDKRKQVHEVDLKKRSLLQQRHGKDGQGSAF